MPMMPMQMGGPPVESTWEELVEGLKIQIANAEKNLLMYKAQLKEAESHIENKTD